MKTSNQFDPHIMCYFSYTDTRTAELLKAALPEGNVDIYSSRAQALFSLDPNSPSLDDTYYAHFREAANAEAPEIKDLPEAFLFDLRIHTPKAYKGPSMAEDAIDRKLSNNPKEDMQAIATAIELVTTHQEQADPRAPKPYIFLKKSEDSTRIARLLTENTGLTVHVFNNEWVHFKADPKSRSWPAKPQAFTSFRPLLEQAEAVSPSPKAQVVELEHAAA